jgi:hypothetical protein
MLPEEFADLVLDAGGLYSVPTPFARLVSTQLIVMRKLTRLWLISLGCRVCERAASESEARVESLDGFQLPVKCCFAASTRLPQHQILRPRPLLPFHSPLF